MAQTAHVLISSRSIPRNLTYCYFIFSDCILLIFTSCLNSSLKEDTAEIRIYQISAYIKITTLERTLSDWVGGEVPTVKFFFFSPSPSTQCLIDFIKILIFLN